MALPEELLITEDTHARIRAHYERAMPWLEKHFGGTPLISVTFPQGFAYDAVFHESFADLPSSIETVTATTSSGAHAFVKLNAHNVRWLCAAKYVVEIDGWGPTFDDPQRAAYARIVLSPHGNVTEDQIFAGAREIGKALAAENLQAIHVLDGFRGLTLWIPFADGPSYDRMSAWVREFARGVAVAMPTLFTVENLKAERGDRIYLGTKSNHPGMGTLLPYAVRGTPGLEVSLPVAHDRLGKERNGQVTAGGFAEYVKLFGDVFENERVRIGAQIFGDRAPKVPAKRELLLAPVAVSPTRYIITTALAVLADGKAHTADDIREQGVAKGLLPESTTRKYVYTALHEYVVRTLGAGRTPEFVQLEGEGAFRINEPVDPWPDIALPMLPRWVSDENIKQLTTKVREASVGGDPTAFEIAVCSALAALGFLATHIGGEGKPDGTLIAPLGTAGYRAVLECKTASPGGVVANPRPEEPAKFRDAYTATHAMLIGPAFGGDASLDDELRAHGVALWTVDDLCTLLEEQVGPDELRPMLEPGRAESALRALLWERGHGLPKRIAVIADRLHRAAWHTQTTLAQTTVVADMPTLTEDTLFVLVDEALAAEGIDAGARLAEVRDAIAMLEINGTLKAAASGFFVRRPPAVPVQV